MNAVDAKLAPHESIALTIALGQMHRGVDVTPNVAAVCMFALGRITGRVAYDAETATYSVPEPGGVA